MATDYISRETAIELLTTALDDDWEPEYAQDRLSEIPAADVRPVVKARWEDETGYIFSDLAQRVYCPVCKSYAYFYPITTKNFCPTCGADMREVSEDG